MSDSYTFTLFDDPDNFYPPSPRPETYTHTLKTSRKELTVELVAKHSLWAHCLWNAGIVVADAIDSGEFNINVGTRVLELGAGAALPSIASVLRGATVVTTDYPDMEILMALQKNINANCEDKPTTVKGYIWGDDVAPLGPKFDLIILADLICNHVAHEALIDTITKCLKPDVGRAIVSFTHHRPHLAAADMKFFEVAKERLKVDKMREEMLKPMFKDDPGDEKMRSMVHVYSLSFT